MVIPADSRRLSSPLRPPEPTGLLPDLTVLVALLLGLWSLDGAPATEPARALLGTGLCVLVGAALSRMALARGLRALEDDDPMMAEAAVRWTVTWPFVAWIAALWVFEWGGWVTYGVPRVFWLARFAVLFTPALVVFAVGWGGRAQLQAKVILRRGGVPMPAGTAVAIMRELKRNAIIFVPLLAVLGITEGAWVAGELGVESLRTLSLWREAMPLIDIALMFALLAVALPLIPRIFARILKATPLEPGMLRTTLERCAESIDLRYHDIMVWRTGGRVFNAMVVGFTPGTRTIFITDGLLNVMPEEELIAVFFHEAGHAKRQHLLLFLVSFFSLSLLFVAANGPLTALGIHPGLQIVLHLALIWFGLLGWVSRRFERESDIFGSKHASVLEPDATPLVVPGLPAPLPRGAALMMRALERIRTIVGRGGSHRHGTVEERVAYVADYATDPDTRLRFQRDRRNLLIGLMALVALAVGATILGLPTEMARAESHVEAKNGLRAYEKAWRLAHGRTTAEVEAAPAKWREDYMGFRSAGHRLAGFEDAQSRALRIRHVYNAADTAQHGLRDHGAARTDFEETLRLIEALPQAERNERFFSLLAFYSHIELGRLAAWAYADAPPGSDERDLGETNRHLEAARELKLRALEDDRSFTEKRRALVAERLRLLVATKELARGEREVARKALVKLAQLGGGSTEWEDQDSIEIAEEAERELARMRR